MFTVRPCVGLWLQERQVVGFSHCCVQTFADCSIFCTQKCAKVALLCRKISEILKFLSSFPHSKALMAHIVHAWSAPSVHHVHQQCKTGHSGALCTSFSKTSQLHNGPAVYINAPSHPSPQLSFFSLFCFLSLPIDKK